MTLDNVSNYNKAQGYAMINSLSKNIQIQILFILAAVVLILALTTKRAEAACSVDTSRGVVTQTFSVPSGQEGSFKFWARMGSTSAGNDSFYIEIDGGTCVLIGGTNVPISGWKWVDYKDGNENNKTTGVQLAAGNHTIKMIGAEDGVKLDKILLVRSDTCVPTDMAGNPCLPDTTPPTVSVSTPTGSLSGTAAKITATASDNDAVATVQFYIDGNKLDPADNQSPYEYLLDTTKFTNGTHKIAARATDGAGNYKDSSEVTVNISNVIPDTTKPTISITSPINNTSVPAGIITVNANANDNIGVTRVEFFVDNATTPIATDTSAPYSSGSSINLSSGNHVIKAKAYDAANNTSEVSVSISIAQAQNGLKCDSNKNGIIDYAEIVVSASYFNKNVPIGTNGDCDVINGVVDIYDLNRIVYEFIHKK